MSDLISRQTENKFERTINASDLQEWIMTMFPDWCEGDIRLIFDHIDKMPSAQPEERTEKRTETHACDLISRQQAIDALDNLDYMPGEWSVRGLSLCKDAIKALPSAQPEVLACGEGELIAQPEIVRCKDCKHWREGTVYSYCDRLYGMGVLDTYDYMVAEDDYCSMAERRTDEND